MAVLTAPLNMLDYNRFWYGEIISITPTSIKLTDGSKIGIYTGEFIYGLDGINGLNGLITGYKEFDYQDYYNFYEIKDT